MRYANPIKDLTNATVIDDAIRFVSNRARMTKDEFGEKQVVVTMARKK